jgi:hypothetical protein
VGNGLLNVSVLVWKYPLRVCTKYGLAYRCAGSARLGRRGMPNIDHGHYQRHHNVEGTAKVSCNGRRCMGTGNKYRGIAILRAVQISHAHKG